MAKLVEGTTLGPGEKKWLRHERRAATRLVRPLPVRFLVRAAAGSRFSGQQQSSS